MNTKQVIAIGLFAALPLWANASLIGTFDFSEGTGSTSYSTDGNYQFQFKHGTGGSDPVWNATASPAHTTGVEIDRANFAYMQLAPVGSAPATTYFNQTLTSRTFTVEMAFTLDAVSLTNYQNWSILSARDGSKVFFDLSTTYRDATGESTFILTNRTATDAGTNRLTSGYDLSDYIGQALYVAVSYNGNYSSNTAYRYNYVIGVAGTDTILASGSNLSVSAAWSTVMDDNNVVWKIGTNSTTYSDVNVGLLKFYDETLSVAQMTDNMAAVVIPEPAESSLALALVCLAVLAYRRKRA